MDGWPVIKAERVKKKQPKLIMQAARTSAIVVLFI
jgi:hypothetical protein